MIADGQRAPKHGMGMAMIETAPGPEDVCPQALPTDPEALRVLVREVIAERDAAIARCARLEHLLDVARNAQYGRSSEKLDDDQLRFALEDDCGVRLLQPCQEHR
jgi:transposase